MNTRTPETTGDKLSRAGFKSGAEALEAMLAEYEKTGAASFRMLAESDPTGYLRLVAFISASDEFESFVDDCIADALGVAQKPQDGRKLCPVLPTRFL